jgi:hypothetical protein
MRRFATPALLLLSAFVLGFQQAPARAQSPTVQKEQTPAQAEQSRNQDRGRAADVRIGRDWKARGGENAHAGRADKSNDHETVGRDWRAHPDNRDR